MANLEYTVLTKTVNCVLWSNSDIHTYLSERLIDVDNTVILPLNIPIKIIVTSSDVLHSFALPSLGLKMDAIPGRLSEQVILIENPGTYWGMCSELCGPYHAFMPYTFNVVSPNVFYELMLNEREIPLI
jgi:heme/copper-type cytochrome/quinol oxidase subunit 2